MLRQAKGAQYKSWIEKAEADRYAAHIPDICNVPSIGCYLVQQATEKYLKAVLISFGEEPQRTHNISALLDHLSLTVDNDLSSQEMVNAGGLLTSYESTTRYPGPIYDIESFEEGIAAFDTIADEMERNGIEGMPHWDDPLRNLYHNHDDEAKNSQDDGWADKYAR